MLSHKPINVLVVDDSETDRLLLSYILTRDSRTHLVGTASTGEEAVEQLQRLKPQVVLMDVTMPGAGGLEATRRIMETTPVPIIVCSGLHLVDPTLSFRAMEAGALTIVSKPRGIGSEDFAGQARSLVDMVCTMAEVRVVRRRARRTPASAVIVEGAEAMRRTADRRLELVVVGASTGGPPALQALLTPLGRFFPLPILVVQHIAPGFVEGMAAWLSQSSGMPVEIARHGDLPRAGRVYLAPDHRHLVVNHAGRMALETGAPEGGHIPAVDPLFTSVVHAGLAGGCAGLLLTGMGSDGAEGLRRLRDAGALTAAQDSASAVINGMPAAAIARGAAEHVLSPEGMAALLKQTVALRESSSGT